MLQFFTDHGLIIVSAALAVSECLSLIPSLKSNGIVQFIINALQNIEGKLTPKA